jgi:hypothetical protein
MRVKRKTMAVAVLAMTFLTALPLALEMIIPSEFFRAFSTMGGIDLAALLNKVAVIGMTMSAFIILRGSVEKVSRGGLVLSIAYKVFWLMIVLFALGLGNIENLGLAVLGGSGGTATNVVMFDFRLIAFLATVIVALMTAHSAIEYREGGPHR